MRSVFLPRSDVRAPELLVLLAGRFDVRQPLRHKLIGREAIEVQSALGCPVEGNLARGEPRLRVAPDDDGVWLWQDTYLVIGAMTFTAERAAAFLGQGDEMTALGQWMQESQRRLLAVRPNEAARAE